MGPQALHILQENEVESIQGFISARNFHQVTDIGIPQFTFYFSNYCVMEFFMSLSYEVAEKIDNMLKNLCTVCSAKV